MLRNVNMDYRNNLRIISKVTPVFSSNMECEEYLVSEEYFYPMTCLENECNLSNSLTDNHIDSEKHDDFYDVNFPSNDFYWEAICQCIHSIAFLKLKNQIKIRIDATVFTVIMIELKRSRTFRVNVLSNLFAHYVRKNTLNTYRLCDFCKKRMVCFHVIVYLCTSQKNILDYKWNGRVQVMINEKCELENAMAWLSTLGGAFSALGDSFIECAEKAGAISVKQLYIAMRLGDPLTVCRCKIYFAMSLLQRGYYKRTKIIMRELYKFSTEGEGSKDFRLKNMCIAVWNRMKYLKSQRTIK